MGRCCRSIFLVNVTLNRKKQITRYFCGESSARRTCGRMRVLVKATAMAACPKAVSDCRHDQTADTRWTRMFIRRVASGTFSQRRKDCGRRRVDYCRRALQRRAFPDARKFQDGCCTNTRRRRRFWIRFMRRDMRSSISGRRSCWR